MALVLVEEEHILVAKSNLVHYIGFLDLMKGPIPLLTILIRLDSVPAIIDRLL